MGIIIFTRGFKTSMNDELDKSGEQQVDQTQPSISSSDEGEPQKLDDELPLTDVDQYLYQKMGEQQPVLESIPSQDGIERTICIRCKRRVARKRDVFCSRCSAKKMQADLQNPLDKTQPLPRDKDQMSDAPAPQVQLVERPTSNMYNRRGAAKVLGVSHNTLRRWEDKGYIDPPKRFIHSKECFYTDEHIQKIRDFMAQERNVPLPEGATLLERPLSRERSSMPVKSFSRKLEKTVAKSLNLSFRGKGLL